MVTIKGLNEIIASLYKDLLEAGIQSEKIILFGSYAKGKPTKYSDIDLAIWSKDFTGCLSSDISKVAAIKSKYTDIELHTYSLKDNEENDPFILEILRTGKEWKVDRPLMFS